ncbi:MAG: heavy metal translocating P-type ATPase [Chloroflexota bacterium]
MGIAGVSLLFLPLLWLTVPILLYTTLPFLKNAYNGFMKDRRVNAHVLDIIEIVGVVASGFFLVGTFRIWWITLSRKLMFQSENHAKNNLSNLFGEQPRTVWVITDDGTEVEIPFAQLQHGHKMMVSAGQVIPVDGIIVEGVASIDQHRLTGESQPAEKTIGDAVLASTVVLAGRIQIQTERAGTETVAMQISQILEQTAEYKDSLQSRGEMIADKATLPTLGMFILCLPLGSSSALAVLSNIFGYKMRLFAPASMLAFLNQASQQGILIKDGRSLDLLREVDTVIFDKTGTLTLEEPTVVQIYRSCMAEQDGIAEDEILCYAAAAEAGQAHPIARAILTAAHQRQLQWPQFEDAKYEVGYGIQVTLPSQLIRVGSDRFMEMENISIPTAIQTIQTRCHQLGHSLVMVACNDTLVGAIELHATIRPEAQALVIDLHRRGMTTHIISGDQEMPTKQLAQMLGIKHYSANTLPENKADLVAALQEDGKSVCFIGDGINDSIALKTANVSISMRGATTVATDMAQIVMMDGTLNQVSHLFDMARRFESNMKTNLLIATIPSMICLGGILFFHWGVLVGSLISGGATFAGLGNAILPYLNNTKNEN